MNIRIPLVTYRLQFNPSFTFRDALELVDYLEELGVTDCYTSPLMQATPKSNHCYDVTDPTRFNSDLGTEEDFGTFAQELRKRDMGVIVDIVPNHMCISVPFNPWWNDILENGSSSLYSNYFDIDWSPLREEMHGKVLLPFLDEQYGLVIENQELKLIFREGCFQLQYFEAIYPTNPRSWKMVLEPVVKEAKSLLDEDKDALYELESVLTAVDHLPSIQEKEAKRIEERQREKEIIKQRLAALTERCPLIQEVIEKVLISFNGIRGAPHTFDHLEKFLKMQPYRLSLWSVASDEINYRRFFDINELAGLRAENPLVFEALHQRLLDLIAKNWVTGVRIDHVDGLYNPYHYLQKLQKACSLAKPNSTAISSSEEVSSHFFMIVEKILSEQESLRSYWTIHGTTGYDFLNLLNGLFVDPEKKEEFETLYTTFTETPFEAEDLVFESKNFILNVSMSSELHVLARHLDRISEQHRSSRDYTYQSLVAALRSVMSCFSVYRSYISASEKRIDREDLYFIQEAINKSKLKNPAINASLFDFIQSVLLLEHPPGLSAKQRKERENFVMRFQQLTGPVMAKGLEDTAFYRAYPLASLNEVGGWPGEFGTTLDTFHSENLKRQEQWPHTLLATSTHDTKRSEDVRARINVLSEIPQLWNDALYRWSAMNRKHKSPLSTAELIPTANEEYLLYQTLIGSWPLHPMSVDERAHYIDRIDKYMNKAMKEAKQHTSWSNPNSEHDENLKSFIHAILTPGENNSFLTDFTSFLEHVLRPGLYNSLVQTVFKVTLPGVPDLYQGCELWSFTLVDPDNRQPVDFDHHRKMLSSLNQQDTVAQELIDNFEDGRIKLFLLKEALRFRKEYPELFQKGDYIPLHATGEKGGHAVAFSRALNGNNAVVVGGRFFHALNNTTLSLGKEVWQQTTIKNIAPGKYRNIFTGQIIESKGELLVGDILEHLPVAILVNVKT